MVSGRWNVLRNLLSPSSLQKTEARNIFYPEDGDSRLCKS